MPIQTALIRLLRFLTVSALTTSTMPAAAWGPIGHRIVADIASANIDGRTAAEIALVMGDETLVEASTYPDEQKSNPDRYWQEQAGYWHYVTLPLGIAAAELPHPPEGDAVTALDRFSATLRDDDNMVEERALALRFIVHIVGDLHVPLHVGDGRDRGGSDFHVLWFNQPATLHWAWEEGLLLRQQLSYSEYSARLQRRMTAKERISWWQDDPTIWIAESAQLRPSIYPTPANGQGDGSEADPVMLSYRYQYRHIDTAEQRLSQAGIRLAAYLNQLFARDN